MGHGATTTTQHIDISRKLICLGNVHIRTSTVLAMTTSSIQNSGVVDAANNVCLSDDLSLSLTQLEYAHARTLWNRKSEDPSKGRGQPRWYYKSKCYAKRVPVADGRGYPDAVIGPYRGGNLILRLSRAESVLTHCGGGGGRRGRAS